ncbi:SMC-Scp complex subunit ScpB [Candidatus Woesearchaeota archaeon CG10_big_fil_rev_8_21_14_0_10_44_13]|nr:MAG: SMC-Scp complex subunit ScpB [Candidatus Woesearchaeota archaeon CG10_big_fil_rev_8_21_14_0_10_44_13]
MKEKEELKKEIEAVLFAAGRKITLDELAKLCRADKKEIDDAVKELKQDYEKNSSPLLLTEEVDGYKLTVREKYLSIVKEVTPHTELNKAMLETLAVIAWKHPAMQSDVIKIRTSKAYEDIRDLVEMGFVSKEKHGRSFILKATGKFFEYFDLPNKDAVKEIFKNVKDVEPETQEKLDNLEVYDDAEKPAQESEKKDEEGEEPKEKLGKLDVFTEPETEVSEQAESEDEPQEDKKETEEAEDKGSEEESEEGDEEKARRAIHKLAGEDVEDNDSDEEEKGSEKNEEEDDEKPKKKRLPKELEEFAGIEDEDKKDKEAGEGD